MCSENARVAQLVERQPSKLNVAGSNPVSRSKASLNSVAFFSLNDLVQFQSLLHKGFYFVQKYEPNVRLLIE